MKDIQSNNETSFQRLQHDLGVRIAGAVPGEKLPPEPELAHQLGVSRSTLREAMRSFEAQGLLMRRQGAGTFVTEKVGVFDTGLEVLESLETIAARTGLEVSMGGLDIEEMKASQELADDLNVPVGSALVSISRVINTNERPVAYLRDILPVDIYSRQNLNKGFTGSVLDLLIRRSDPPLEQSRTEIRAVTAQLSEARALQIQRGDVLLMLEANLITQTGQVVDHSYSFFLPGYFRFHVNRKIGII